ncbi:hypothetical protein CPB86DRAFT_192227 [Serendipita vermifera]|nr:hypothetical protein CPB86DRAFT_192227 [Serendipita vermifera]
MNGSIISSSLPQLAKHEEFYRPICDAILKLIQDFEDSDSKIGTEAAKSLAILAKLSIFHDVLAGVVPRYIQLLKHPDIHTQLYAIKILVDLKGPGNSYEKIAEVIPSIVELLKSPMMHIVWEVSTLLCSLATHRKQSSIAYATLITLSRGPPQHHM